MDQVINQVALYVLQVVGALGVALALPRRGVNPQLLGALLAAAAGGLIMVLLGFKAREHLPNVYFYVFSAIALGAALRVITHPRPVYAALYFILTILASAGLFVILSAEFLAFALVIVYAGAILITYLFVIMLATQAPTEDQLETLAEYDAVSREPLAATAVGFLLLGVLTTMLFRGLGELPDPPTRLVDSAIAPRLPGRYEPARVEEALRRAGLMHADETIVRTLKGTGPAGAPLIDLRQGLIAVGDAQGNARYVEAKDWPPELQTKNVEGVAFELLADHPGAIEIAGVILLMAMLGAVVLARKQVQIDEEGKARHAAHLAGGGGA